MRCLRIALGLAAALSVAAPARAQDPRADLPPAHLSLVEGSATLDREDTSDPAGPGMPIVPGDRLRTAQGRAEILFPDGSALDVDEYSTIEMLGPTLITLTEGRVILFVAGVGSPSGAPQFRIDTPAASATSESAGEFRVSVFNGASGLQTELAVLRGYGALTTDTASMRLAAGERSTAWAGGPPSDPQMFNAARYDAFDTWASGLRDRRGASQSARYLPSDLRMYGGALDQYGGWEYEAPYGYVWYPTVATDWRPYYDGYWSSVPRYGWTWVGVNGWSWPTHHYGRWGYGRNRWYWIPDRRWATAWVSWGSAPGYVSWSPLGYNNRPVFGFSVATRNAWFGWTVLPRDRFGMRDAGWRRYAVAPRSIPAGTPFVAHAAAPIAAPRRVSRDNGSARFGTAVPRDGSSGSAGVAVPRGSFAARRPEVTGRAQQPPPQPARPVSPPSGYSRTLERRYIPATPTPPAAPASGRAVPRNGLPETIRGESIPPESYRYRNGYGGSPDRRTSSGAAAPVDQAPVPNPSDGAVYRGRSGSSETGRPSGDIPRYGSSSSDAGGRRRQQAAPAPQNDSQPAGRDPRYERAVPRGNDNRGGSVQPQGEGRGAGRSGDNGRSNGGGRSNSGGGGGGEGRRGSGGRGR